MMQTPQEAMNPWLVLSVWPGWRGLRDTLQSLEQTLRHVGAMTGAASGAIDVADAIAALLNDPASACVTANYRLRCSLRKTDPPVPADGAEMDTELLGWVDELARYVVDTQVLLDAAGAAAFLGSALTVDLPRFWQARCAGVVRSLQQMLQASRGRKVRPPQAAPITEPMGAPAPLPVTRPGQYIVPTDSGYAVVIPEEAAAATMQAAWTELAAALLRDLGPDAMRLHLLLLTGAPAQSIPFDAVFASLGLERRRAGLRHHHTSRCYEAIQQLQRIRLSVYRWALSGGTLTYERTDQDLWHLRVHEYGQARVFEHSGALATHGEDWALVPGRGSWMNDMPAEVAAALARLSRILLSEVEGARNAWSLAMGALLANAAVPKAEQVIAIPTAAILQLTGPASAANDAEARQVWQGFWAAVRLQRRWGWQAERSDWHDTVRKHYAARRQSDPQAEGPVFAEPGEPPAETAWSLFLQGTTTFRFAPEA